MHNTGSNKPASPPPEVITIVDSDEEENVQVNSMRLPKIACINRNNQNRNVSLNPPSPPPPPSIANQRRIPPTTLPIPPRPPTVCVPQTRTEEEERQMDLNQRRFRQELQQQMCVVANNADAAAEDDDDDDNASVVTVLAKVKNRSPLIVGPKTATQISQMQVLQPIVKMKATDNTSFSPGIDNVQQQPVAEPSRNRNNAPGTSSSSPFYAKDLKKLNHHFAKRVEKGLKEKYDFSKPNKQKRITEILTIATKNIRKDKNPVHGWLELLMRVFGKKYLDEAIDSYKEKEAQAQAEIELERMEEELKKKEDEMTKMDELRNQKLQSGLRNAEDEEAFGELDKKYTKHRREYLQLFQCYSQLVGLDTSREVTVKLHEHFLEPVDLTKDPVTTFDEINVAVENEVNRILASYKSRHSRHWGGQRFADPTFLQILEVVETAIVEGAINMDDDMKDRTARKLYDHIVRVLQSRRGRDLQNHIEDAYVIGPAMMSSELSGTLARNAAASRPAPDQDDSGDETIDIDNGGNDFVRRGSEDAVDLGQPEIERPPTSSSVSSGSSSGSSGCGQRVPTMSPQPRSQRRPPPPNWPGTTCAAMSSSTIFQRASSSSFSTRTENDQRATATYLDLSHFELGRADPNEDSNEQSGNRGGRENKRRRLH